MKPIMITLMYLTFGGDIKLDTFEIFTSCSYYKYQDKKVIGYICGGEEPR
jgi:hypothetical protein